MIREATQAHHADIESMNQNILRIDLDDLEVETLEERLELTLALFFDTAAEDDAGGATTQGGCAQFSCQGYWQDPDQGG